jgi:DnaJ-domain-containing protein 1
MKSVSEEIFKDQKLLTRFIWKLQFLPDTPALIQFVAGDEDYLALCSRIVSDTGKRSQDLRALKEICQQQDLNFQVLVEKLTPVARAFGLVDDESDYYEVLGISRNADTVDIKKAFRKRVIDVHPDTSDQMGASSLEFINLQAAYQILSDPVLRQQYDENLRDVNLWKERIQQNREFRELNPSFFHHIKEGSPARNKIVYQLGGLFLFLIIMVFIFDFVYQQNSIFDGDQFPKQKQVTRTKTVEKGMTPDAYGNTGQKNTKVKLLPNHSNNFHKIATPEDPSQPANPKINAHAPEPAAK